MLFAVAVLLCPHVKNLETQMSAYVKTHDIACEDKNQATRSKDVSADLCEITLWGTNQRIINPLKLLPHKRASDDVLVWFVANAKCLFTHQVIRLV